jgi:DNA-binding transcriptional ArsR family regulator
MPAYPVSMSLLPSRADVRPDPDEPTVLDLNHADEAFEALGSETARGILSTLYETPRTPPEVREEVGTSLQNVHYHLDRLEDADLIEPAGTGYSAKGNEMTVYAPAREAVVLFAGREADRTRLRDLLARVVGALALLAVGALAFARLVEWLRPDRPEPEVMMTAQDGGGEMAEQGGTALPTLVDLLSDPAVAFFLGGLLALCLAAAWWYWQPR